MEENSRSFSDRICDGKSSNKKLESKSYISRAEVALLVQKLLEN